MAHYSMVHNSIIIIYVFKKYIFIITKYVMHNSFRITYIFKNYKTSFMYHSLYCVIHSLWICFKTYNQKLIKWEIFTFFISQMQIFSRLFFKWSNKISKKRQFCYYRKLPFSEKNIWIEDGGVVIKYNEWYNNNKLFH